MYLLFKSCSDILYMVGQFNRHEKLYKYIGRKTRLTSEKLNANQTCIVSKDNQQFWKQTRFSFPIQTKQLSL